MKSAARISAIGSYVPEHILTNEALEKLVDTNDEWIVKRTGIRERRIAAEEEFTSHMCIQAVEDLAASYKGSLEDIELVIVATTTPDYPYPSVACIVQDHFGLLNAGAVDINATCAGFAYGLHLANGLISSGLHKKILVIAGETMSKVTNYEDRSTCILFGDGAGAAIVEYDAEHPSFDATVLGSEGSGGKHVYRAGLATAIGGMPLEGEGKIYQNGREVYKWAVRTVPEGISKLLQDSGTTVEELDWFVPHSANLKMIDSICEKTGIPAERTLTSAEYYGNTSSATIPLSLQLAQRQGKLKFGDRLILFGFGAGLTYAGLMLKWGVQE
ncbi:ketoacyl-ACP synthase III [Paenibacillus sp. J22TS3]|uniref:ketoacyl-ACP synthase III n=1 Tax=Paenibacillus sp. J22TS3 TaxID=2807192 RepID=UPI001B0A5F20|nr:ketoacyl-ACP synthase III [Paenibacillus sp. J22TS3]GIP23005.1 3-oxoacyl-[acyl-carrier-protein] synthase 3 protein 2 [Paenibacillus sp. J22TS3]